MIVDSSKDQNLGNFKRKVAEAVFLLILILWTVNNHIGRTSIPSKQQLESLMCIHIISHRKCTQPSKVCDKCLSIIVATLGLCSGKQSITKNIMSQPPVLQLPIICLEKAAQRGMNHVTNYPLSCALQCATCRFQSNPKPPCKISGAFGLHPVWGLPPNTGHNNVSS